MTEKIKLDLVGITYNQIESGVYAVILQQSGGIRRIPIIIGASEAQSIECRLQEVITPRPLTHDLMVNIMRAFGLTLKEVWLHTLKSGVFAADLLLSDGERELTIDSRSSDAIALAVRTGTPIYTSPEVLEKSGFDPDIKKAVNEQENTTATSDPRGFVSIDKLRRDMQKAVEEENYEEAGRLKREIERREQAESENPASPTDADDLDLPF